MKDDFDGVPIDEDDNGLDGFPLAKGGDSGMDIDGIPLSDDIDGAPSELML